MWLGSAPDVSDRLASLWQNGDRQSHRIALYQIPIDGHATLLGVASAEPVDTARWLEKFAIASLSDGTDLVRPNSDLSPDHVRSLDTVQIVSASFETERGRSILDFAERTSTEDLPDQALAGMTVIVGAEARPVILNLFTDNQFYIADATPDDIGPIAERVARALWGGQSARL